MSSSHPLDEPNAARLQEASTRRVLIVEVNAHLALGHYPVAFAELAASIHALGHEVEALTRQGWRLATDPGVHPVRVRRFGAIARAASRAVDRVLGRARRPVARRARELAQTVVALAAAQRLVRHARFSDVIVFSEVNPFLGLILVRRGRWLAYQFRVPPRLAAGREGRERWVVYRTIDRPLMRLSAAVAERATPRFRVALSNPAMREAWDDGAPWLHPTDIPFIAARPHEPSFDARERLGLPEGRRLALLFGGHGNKDAATVWRAFEALPDWQLVVAGSDPRTQSLAASYRAWVVETEATSECRSEPILFEGFVEEEMRSLLFSAVDLVVVSFKRRTRSDSGNLVDAIAWGRAVVCSDHCPSAEVTRRHGLGTVFEPGDAESLVRAVRAVHEPEPEGLRRARLEFDPHEIARRNLDAMGATTEGFSNRR